MTHTKISREHVSNSLTVDCDHAFTLALLLLYNKHEGEDEVELMLKQSCCVKDSSANYVVDIHFTTKMIYTSATSKRISGRSISIMVDSILTLMKKALSLGAKIIV